MHERGLRKFTTVNLQTGGKDVMSTESMRYPTTLKSPIAASSPIVTDDGWPIHSYTISFTELETARKIDHKVNLNVPSFGTKLKYLRLTTFNL